MRDRSLPSAACPAKREARRRVCRLPSLLSHSPLPHSEFDVQCWTFDVLVLTFPCPPEPRRRRNVPRSTFHVLQSSVFSLQSAVCSLRSAVFGLLLALCALPVQAADLTWTGAIDANWDAVTANWSGGSTIFTAGDNVTFSDGATVKHVSVNGTQLPNSILFNNNADLYSITSGTISGGGPLSVTGGGDVYFGVNSGMPFTSSNINRPTMNHGDTAIINGSLVNVTTPQGTFSFGSGSLSLNDNAIFRVTGRENQTYRVQNAVTINGGIGGSGNLRLQAAGDGTGDFDGDGVLDLHEYWAGTDPTDAGDYMRITDLELSAPDSDSIQVTFHGGLQRRFDIRAATDPDAATQSVGTIARSHTHGEMTWTDTDAVLNGDRRYYNISVFFDTGGYTNTMEQWAMYRQPRQSGNRYLISPPVDYGATTNLNLNAQFGSQLARGLHAGSGAGDSDRIQWLDESGNWQEAYLYNDGGNIYWNTTNAGPADVYLPPGSAFWVVRGNNAPSIRTNAVFLGRSFTSGSVTNEISISKDGGTHGGWSMFGWPYARVLRQSNTATCQLGFVDAGAVGGTSANQHEPEKLGDQIWVWQNNMWARKYWLVYREDRPDLNNRWWDNRGFWAEIELQPGQGYYYFHTTNNAATNFMWTPPAP